MSQEYRLRRLHRDEDPILRVKLFGSVGKPSEGVKLLAFTDTGYRSIVANGNDTPIPRDFAMIEILLVPETKTNSVELKKFVNHALETYIEDMYNDEFEFLSRTKLDLLMWVLRLSPYDDTSELVTSEGVFEEDLSHIPCMKSMEQYNMDVGFETFMPANIIHVLQKTSTVYEHEKQGCDITSVMFNSNWGESYREVLQSFVDADVSEEVMKSLSRDVAYMSNLAKSLEFFMNNKGLRSSKQVVSELLSTGNPRGVTAENVYDSLAKSLVVNMPRMVEGFKQLESHLMRIGLLLEGTEDQTTYTTVKLYHDTAFGILEKWSDFKKEYTENEFKRFVSSDKDKIYSEIVHTRERQLSWIRENTMTALSLVNKDWINKSLGVDVRSPEYIAGSKEPGSRSLSEYLNTCSPYWREDNITEEGKILRQIFFNMDIPCSFVMEQEDITSVRGTIDGSYTSDISSIDSFENFLLVPRSRDNSSTRQRSYQRRPGASPLDKSRSRLSQSRRRGALDTNFDFLGKISEGTSSFPVVPEDDEVPDEEPEDSPQDDLRDIFGEKDKEIRPGRSQGETFLRGEDGRVLARTRGMTMRSNRGGTMRDTMGRTLMFFAKGMSPMIDIVSKLDDVPEDAIDDTRVSAITFFADLLAMSRVYRFKKSRSLEISKHMSNLLCDSVDSFDNFFQVSIELDKVISQGAVITKNHLKEYADVDFYTYDYTTVDEGSIPTFIYLTCMNVYPVLSSILVLYGNLMDREAVEYLSGSIKKLYDIREYFRTFGVDLWMRVENKRHERDMDHLEEVKSKEKGSYTPPYTGLLGVPKGSVLPGSSKSLVSNIKHDMHELMTGRTIKDAEAYLEDNKNIVQDLLRRHLPEDEVVSSAEYLTDLCNELRKESLNFTPFHEGFSRPLNPKTFEEMIIQSALCGEEGSVSINSRYQRSKTEEKAILDQRTANMVEARKVVGEEETRSASIREKQRNRSRSRQRNASGPDKVEKKTSTLTGFAEMLRSKLRRSPVIEEEDGDEDAVVDPVNESVSFLERLREQLKTVKKEDSPEVVVPSISEPIEANPVEEEHVEEKEHVTPVSLFIEASTDIQKTRNNITNALRFHNTFAPFN